MSSQTAMRLPTAIMVRSAAKSWSTNLRNLVVGFIPVLDLGGVVRTRRRSRAVSDSDTARGLIDAACSWRAALHFPCTSNKTRPARGLGKAADMALTKPVRLWVRIEQQTVRTARRRTNGGQASWQRHFLFVLPIGAGALRLVIRIVIHDLLAVWVELRLPDALGVEFPLALLGVFSHSLEVLPSH